MNVTRDKVNRFVDRLIGETTTSGAIADVPMPMVGPLRKGDGDPLTPADELEPNQDETDPAFKRDKA